LLFGGANTAEKVPSVVYMLTIKPKKEDLCEFENKTKDLLDEIGIRRRTLRSEK